MVSKRAAATAPLCQLLLRVIATLTNAFRAAKIAPPRVEKGSQRSVFFPPGERNAGLADCSLAPSFIISAAEMAYVAPALA